MSTKVPKCNCYHKRSLHAAEVCAEAADTHAREVEEALTEEFRLHAEARAELAALKHLYAAGTETLPCAQSVAVVRQSSTALTMFTQARGR